MIARVLAPVVLALALAGPGFDGCSGGPPPGVVPPATTATCFADADCHAMGCELVGCVASQCMTIAAMRDLDHDGFAPPGGDDSGMPRDAGPVCGDDCDDTDSNVHPGATEICNRRDDDCDGIIDEDAAPNAITTLLGTASTQIAAAAIGRSMVITDTAFTSGARLRVVDFGGVVSAAVPVIAAPIAAIDVATTTTGGVVAIGRMLGSGFVIEAYPITLTAGVLAVLPAMTLAMRTNLPGHVRVEAVGASFVVVWDEPSARFAIMPSWPAPVSIGMVANAPFDVASDGTSIAIPSAQTALTFLSPSDGSVMRTQTFTGALASDPLTAGAHDYVVAFDGGTDPQLARLTETAIQTMHLAPRQGMGLPLRVDETPLGTLVTRFDATNVQAMGTGVWALLLPDTLDTVRADFSPSVVSRGIAGPATDFDVVASAAGTAVFTNFGTHGSVLTVLICQPH